MTIARAIMTDDPAERQAYLNHAILLAAVQRAIFSPSGAILDIRRAVLVTLTIPPGDGREPARTAQVMTGDEYDTKRDKINELAGKVGATVEIIDGRDYTARGTLRKRR